MLGQGESGECVIQPKFRRLFSSSKIVGEQYLFSEELEESKSSMVITKITSSGVTGSNADRGSKKIGGAPYS
jgi:hypothetical protein